MSYLKITTLFLILSFVTPGIFAKPGDVVATVGNKKITLDEFSTQYNKTSNSFNRPSAEVFLEDYVRFEVGVQEAYKRKLQNDPIVQQRMKEEVYKLLLEKEIGPTINKIKVSESEMISEYKNSPELRTSHILIEFKPGSTAKEKGIAKKRAFEVFKSVRTSKRSFEELVKLYSDDTISKVAGGDIGYQSRVTAVPTYYDAALRLKVGQIYPKLVETAYGFHIIKLTGRRTYQQADKTQLKAIVFEAKRKKIFDNFFFKLKKKYKISTNKEPLKQL